MYFHMILGVKKKPNLRKYILACVSDSHQNFLFLNNMWRELVVFSFTLCCVSATLWNTWEFYKK